MLVYPYLSLLADDGDSILQFDIMEKALQKNVSHSYQVVVLLRLIEWVTVITVCLDILKKQRKTSIISYFFFSTYPFLFLILFLTISSVPSFQSL